MSDLTKKRLEELSDEALSDVKEEAVKQIESLIEQRGFWELRLTAIRAELARRKSGATDTTISD